MLFTNRTRWLAMFARLVGVLMLMAMWKSSPTLVQGAGEKLLLRLQTNWQTVMLKDTEGNTIAPAEFRATVTGDDKGEARGYILWQVGYSDNLLNSSSFHFNPTDLTIGKPNGWVEIRGQVTISRNGLTSGVPVTATVMRSSASPSVLLWEVFDVPVLGSIQFEAEGTLSFP